MESRKNEKNRNNTKLIGKNCEKKYQTNLGMKLERKP